MLPNGDHVLAGLVDEVLRCHGRLLTGTADLGTEDGLTGAQLLVRTAVVRAERRPTVPQTGRSLGVSLQAVQRIVGSLVERGLIWAEDHSNPYWAATGDGGRRPSLRAQQ